MPFVVVIKCTSLTFMSHYDITSCGGVLHCTQQCNYCMAHHAGWNSEWQEEWNYPARYTGVFSCYY